MEEDKVRIKMNKVLLASEREELKKKRQKTIITTVIVIILFFAGVGVGYKINKIKHPSYDLEAKTTLGEIEYILDKYWLYSYDYDEFIQTIEDNAFYGMASFDEDPYTTYMSADEISMFATSINMNYVGIGVSYTPADGLAVVKKIFKDSPAQVAGMMVGDIITHVDGESIKDYTSTQVKNLVMGEVGSKVVLTVQRANEVLDITVVRDNVDSSVYAYATDNYVVLQLLSFGKNTAATCMTYLDSYSDYKNLIIDLRDNGGGYQSSVQEIAGFFIGNNEVYMRQVDKNGNETIDYTKCEKTYDNFENIILLVNDSTASAAEVLTICLKEKLNVTIVGVTTYGKGVMQSEYSLSNGGYIKVTSYKWLSPDGICINGDGIAPDYEVYLPDLLYESFSTMDEQEYAYDSVSEYARVCQVALKFMGYDVNRDDGYFDKEFEDAIKKFQEDHDLEVNGILNDKTYMSIYYEAYVLSVLPQYDTQMLKAVELLEK